MTIIRKTSKPVDDSRVTDMEMSAVNKILILAANPGDTGRLQLDKEFREIQAGLSRAKFRSQFDIQPRFAVRFSDIRQALLDYNPHIVHFAGHGDKDGLMVEGELGLAVPITAQVLSQLFELCSHHVECVVLNACYSAFQATAINKHIKYVIGMRKEIEDRAAIKFAVGFYDALGAGRSVEDAFKFGCIEIRQIFPGFPGHLIPVLKKRKERMINIQVRIESTGDVFNFKVAPGERTSAVKNRLIDEMRLAKTFEDGQPVVYYLFSKTRDEPLRDAKTMRENGVQNNDVFVFLIEADAC